MALINVGGYLGGSAGRTVDSVGWMVLTLVGVAMFAAWAMAADGRPPVTLPIDKPRWGDVVNPALRRAVRWAATVGVAGAVTCLVLATRDGWGESWTPSASPSASEIAAVCLTWVVFLTGGLWANHWSAERFGRARGVTGSDVLVLFVACTLPLSVVFLVGALVLRPA
ncbi:MAG: hypothetical protein ACRCYR_17725 [Phycicoccus sp.]